MKSLQAVLVFLFITLINCTQDSEPVTARAQAGEGKTNSNIALLVGINKYPNLDQRFQLGGCVNDVEMMQQLLWEKFQFNKANILVLKDEEATRENIIRQFNEFLIAKASPTAQAVFYYSGHGSQMTDMNSDEMDGFDETIVPHDGRDPQQNILDIPDDELGELLAQLAEKSNNVTVILDCCNSGSGVRGGDADTDAVARLIDPLVLDKPRTKSGAPKQDGLSGFLPPNPNYVLISGSKDEEFSYEFEGNGALTLAINEAMRESPKATYRELMYKVNELVTSRHKYQHPQLEGPRRNAKIFGDLGVVEQAVEVAKVNQNKVELNGGKAHKVTENSVYELFKPGTTSTRDRNKYLATVRITDVKQFSASAEVTDRKGEIVEKAAAFEIFHYYGDLQLPVRLNLDNAPALKEKIKAALKLYKKSEDLVKVVSEKYRVKLSYDANKNKLVLQRPDLTEIKTMSADDNSIKFTLMETLTQIARYQNTFDLENLQSKLNVKMSLKRWEKVDANANPINQLEISEEEGGQRYLLEEDIINVTIKNNSDKEVYVYLFDLGTDGSVSLLFPAVGAKDSPLAPAASIISFAMRVTPPEGLNALKLIATTQPTDFAVLIQAGFRGVGSRSGDSRGTDSLLGQLLNLAWGGTRNVEQIKPVTVDDWGTDMVSFNIKFREKMSGK